MKRCITICLVLIIAVIFTGCFGRTKQPYIVDQFTLEYPSPVLPGLTSTHGDYPNRTILCGTII